VQPLTHVMVRTAFRFVLQTNHTHLASMQRREALLTHVASGLMRCS
jgi:hypothetical protein